MDPNNTTQHQQHPPSTQQTTLYTYNNNNINDPEEAETVTTTNQTKRYKGVWRKNGRWVARIRDPVSNTRVFLGKFSTHEHALKAYYDKKSEFEGFIKSESGLDLVVVDRNGFLLGEFSRLDDDLKICE